MYGFGHQGLYGQRSGQRPFGRPFNESYGYVPRPFQQAHVLSESDVLFLENNNTPYNGATYRAQMYNTGETNSKIAHDYMKKSGK